jgi:hypothetical protein
VLPEGQQPDSRGSQGTVCPVRTSNLLKKTYREARGEVVVDEEDKVMQPMSYASYDM